MLEKDLFPPVKALFEKNNYVVNAEVKDCDIVAHKDDETVIVELKLSLSTALLAQALDRQRICPNVYIAVPRPKKYNKRNFRKTLNLIKKLELGLIFVVIHDAFAYTEVICEPAPFTGTKIRSKLKNSLISEYCSRQYDKNIGGVSRRKIATAYTEMAVHIACLLEKYGELSTKQLREYGSDSKKTTSILYNNFYGWFTHVSKGVYTLSEKWNNNSDYSELIEYYRSLINNEQSFAIHG